MPLEALPRLRGCVGAAPMRRLPVDRDARRLFAGARRRNNDVRSIRHPDPCATTWTRHREHRPHRSNPGDDTQTPNPAARVATTRLRAGAGALDRDADRVTRQDEIVILWRYPAEPLLEDVEYSDEIEAEEPGVWVLVVRDPDNIPRA